MMGKRYGWAMNDGVDDIRSSGDDVLETAGVADDAERLVSGKENAAVVDAYTIRSMAAKRGAVDVMVDSILCTKIK